MLTGKCKEDFEKWVKKLYVSNLHFRNIHDTIGLELLPFSMQYGVYVDFFDSVGIDVDLFFMNTKIFWNKGDKPWIRPIAQTKAIEKANGFYNLNKEQ